jgi:hypothetical protein
MDHVALLVDPSATPADELRRFQEYVNDTSAALAIEQSELDCLLDTAEPIDEVDRYNQIRDAELMRQRIDVLRRTLSVRSQHLQTVRRWVLSTE